uniref:Uncharacterized protein n=1 Tax=Oryza meridionalis TaxID=40149 RepID=A0A0E0DAV7_9ORYZ
MAGRDCVKRIKGLPDASPSRSGPRCSTSYSVTTFVSSALSVLAKAKDSTVALQGLLPGTFVPVSYCSTKKWTAHYYKIGFP